jgi:hypothetical protein
MNLFRWLFSSPEVLHRLLLIHAVCIIGIIALFLVFLPVYFKLVAVISFVIVLVRQWYVVVKLYGNEGS